MLQDNGSSLEHRSAVIGRELERYGIDIAALGETRLPGVSHLEERGSGYKFYWSGKPESDSRQAGVGFAIKTKHINLLDVVPTGMSERLMTGWLKLDNERYATITSTYAPTMTNTDEIKEKFYNDISAVIVNISLWQAYFAGGLQRPSGIMLREKRWSDTTA